MPYDSTARWRVTFEDRKARPSVNDVVDELLRAADQGLLRDARGRRLTAPAARELHWSLGGYVRESLGHMKLSEVRARDVTGLLDDLDDSGLSRRRLRPIVESVRTLYDHAIERGLVQSNPAAGLAVSDESDSATASSDVAIARGIRLATVGFVLVAAVLLLQTVVA
jgi:hypothetical protein